MLKNKFLFLLLILNGTCAFSQKAILTGKLSDKEEKRPVKNAVFALIRQQDSVLYKFTRTDADGNFSLLNIRQGNYFILTTHPLFADYTDSITIREGQNSLGNISLINKRKLLQEVILKSGSPIRIKGDTIVYTADSFKVKDGASVEDLLRKMPGFQVGKNGELKAMGETVKNVLVDGEEFFGNDPGMVLKNLQANIVQEVQVYDKKSEQASFTGIDDGIKEKTVNLKLKANKKQGYFGKAALGGGTPDNYDNSLMINAFKAKRKFSVYGFMSNTGRTDLGWQDGEKYGGGEIDGMTSGVTDDGGVWMSYSNNGEDSYFKGRNGIPKNWNSGMHYSNKFKGDSLNITTSYRFAKVNAPGFSKTFSKTYLPDSSWGNNSNASSFSSKERHNMSFTLESKLDSNNTIKFINRASTSSTGSNSNYYEESLTNQKKFINNSTRATNNTSDAQNYQGTLTWNHKFKKERRTFSATADAGFNKSNAKINLYSLNNFYKGSIITRKDTIDQRTRGNTSSQTFTGNAAYTEPLSKYFSLGITYMATISNSSNNRIVFNKDAAGNYASKVDSLSNDFDYNRYVQRPGINLRINKKRISAGFGAALAFNKFVQANNSKGTKQDYDFTNFFPNANVNFKLKGSRGLRINYNGSAEAPTLQQLQPIIDNSNPLSIFIGNSNLKQSFTHSVFTSFNWNKPLTDQNIWSYASYGFTSNAFTRFNRIDSLGRNVYQTVNVNGNNRFSFNFDYSFAIGSGRKKLNLSIDPMVNFNRNIDFVNAIKNINNSGTYGLEFSLGKYVEDKYDFNIRPGLTFTHSGSSINPNSNTDFWGFNGWADASFSLKKNLSFNTNANFSFRQKDPRFPQNNNSTTWNADIKKYVYKKELSLKLGINDILNQNRGYENNFSSYKFTETYFNSLKRYWLCTVTWEFTHNKKQSSAPAIVPEPIKK